MDEEGDELSLDECSEVGSSALDLSSRSDLIASGEVTELSRTLGDLTSLTGLMLDLFVILLAEILRILKFKS